MRHYFVVGYTNLTLNFQVFIHIYFIPNKLCILVFDFGRGKECNKTIIKIRLLLDYWETQAQLSDIRRKRKQYIILDWLK